MEVGENLLPFLLLYLHLVKAIGKISGPKGLEGELKIKLYYDIILEEEDSLMLQMHSGSFIPYSIDYILDTHKDGMTKLLKLEEINDRNQALQVSKKELWVEDDFFENRLPIDSYYRLIGYTLWNDKQEVGTVTDIIEMTQIIMILGDEKQGIFIPLVEDWIVKQDPDTRTLVMELPEGLVDINT